MPQPREGELGAAAGALWEPSPLSLCQSWTTGCGTKPRAFSLSQVAEEQRKRLYQRPQDMGLVLVLLLIAAFTFFRGMVSAGSLHGDPRGAMRVQGRLHLPLSTSPGGSGLSR